MIDDGDVSVPDASVFSEVSSEVLLDILTKAYTELKQRPDFLDNLSVSQLKEQ